MENELNRLSSQLAGIVEQTSHLVVSVHARARMYSSGILWRPGIIVTAAHTVEREEDIGVTLPDGRRIAATLAGRDAGTDLAVLRADTTDTAVTATAAPAPGNLVLAIGRSPDSGVNASMGIISAVSGRQWRTWRGGKIDNYIRLDLNLFPGSSGGAVVDGDGHVAGMATSGLSRIAAVAIPPSTVDRVTDELLARGYVRRGYLGVALQPVALPEHLVTKLKLDVNGGIIVLSVEPDSGAASGGLLLGDIIVALGGKSVSSTDDVQDVLTSLEAGESLAAIVVRGGERAELTIPVGEWPRGAGR